MHAHIHTQFVPLLINSLRTQRSDYGFIPPEGRDQVSMYLFSPSNLEWLKPKRSWLEVPSGEDLQVLELQGYKGSLGLNCAGKSKIKTHSSVDYHGQTKLLVFSLGTSLADNCLCVKVTTRLFLKRMLHLSANRGESFQDNSETTSYRKFLRVMIIKMLFQGWGWGWGCCLKFRGWNPKLRARNLLTMCQDTGGRQKGTG